MRYQMQLIPEVTKNLIIINVLMYLATLAFEPMTSYLALFPTSSTNFAPYQIVTHMFMHSRFSFMHIFFNMFALFMFGRDVELAMGAKRFLLFYFVTGLGAAFLHSFVNYIEVQQAIQGISAEKIALVQKEGYGLMMSGKAYADTQMQYLNELINTPAVGASGAIYGVLAAFGMLYPNRMIMLLIPPIPMKAKYFILIMGAIELYLGLSQSQSGVAHFAHLGGAIFGVLLIIYWRKRGERF